MEDHHGEGRGQRSRVVETGLEHARKECRGQGRGRMLGMGREEMEMMEGMLCWVEAVEAVEAATNMVGGLGEVDCLRRRLYPPEVRYCE